MGAAAGLPKLSSNAAQPAPPPRHVYQSGYQETPFNPSRQQFQQFQPQFSTQFQPQFQNPYFQPQFQQQPRFFQPQFQQPFQFQPQFQNPYFRPQFQQPNQSLQTSFDQEKSAGGFSPFSNILRGGTPAQPSQSSDPGMSAVQGGTHVGQQMSQLPPGYENAAVNAMHVLPHRLQPMLAPFNQSYDPNMRQQVQSPFQPQFGSFNSFLSPFQSMGMFYKEGGEVEEGIDSLLRK